MKKTMLHSKKQLKDQCSEILKKYPAGQVITNLNEFEFLSDIFTRHPEADQKIGKGIKNIFIGFDGYKGKCFYIQRLDYSQTDISFIKCIDGKPSKLSEIKMACRSAIEKDILKFKNDEVVFGITACALTGELLTPENIHIDHYDLDFKDLFAEWIAGQDIDYLHSKINPTRDGEYKTYFTDQNIIIRFRLFHNLNTHLRAVTMKANLGRNKKNN